MTAPIRGELIQVPSKADAAARFAENVRASKMKAGGWEVEFYVVNSFGQFSRADNQRFFAELQSKYDPTGGGGVKPVTESYVNKDWIIGLEGGALEGNITEEPGLFPEYATSINLTAEDVRPKLTRAIENAKAAAGEIGHTALFQGVVDRYAEELLEHSPRARAFIWECFARQCDQHLGRHVGDAIRLVHYGTAGAQPTVDTAGEEFPHVKSVALIGDPILSLEFNENNDRLARIGMFAEYFPMEFRPLTEAWLAKTVEETSNHIMNRVWDLEVAFRNPDPDNLHNYVLTPLRQKGTQMRPPTVGELVEAGRGRGSGIKFTYHDLCNAQGVMFDAGGACRKFMKPTVEWRMLDSTDNVDNMVRMLDFAMTMSYDADMRSKFLEGATIILGATPEGVNRLYRAAMNRNKMVGLNTRVGIGGITAGQIAHHAVEYRNFDRLLANVTTHDLARPAPDQKSRQMALTFEGGDDRAPALVAATGGGTEHGHVVTLMSGAVGDRMVAAGEQVVDHPVVVDPTASYGLAARSRVAETAGGDWHTGTIEPLMR